MRLLALVWHQMAPAMRSRWFRLTLSLTPAGRISNFPDNVLPSASKNSGKPFDNLDRDIGFAMLDLLHVALAQGREVGQFGLRHLSPNAETVDVLTDDLAPFHWPQLARKGTVLDAL